MCVHDNGHILDRHTSWRPGADFEAFLETIPSKWVVYLLSDEADRPVQLLCVKNLRASLKRRLSGEEMPGPTRRVNYREIVRHVRWRRVDSLFEADWLYYEAARLAFPQTYQGMVGFRPAWFVHVDPEAPFPRYIKTTQLADCSGALIGPVESRQAATELIARIEDAFDLCRYHNILAQAPNGAACAYKEMGKCPAPCDGSISMEQYRRMVEWSVATLIDPSEMIHGQTNRMNAAAAELRFESAGKIKAHLEQLSQLGKGPYRHARLLKHFAFLSLQRGPRAGSAKAFLITPEGIEEIAGLIAEPVRPVDLLRLALVRAEERAAHPLDAVSAERISIVTHHLFLARQTHGVFLRLDSIDEKSILKAFRNLQRQKMQEAPEEEQVVKELRAMGGAT